MAADFSLGESLVGDGNEVAHIDLIIGSKSGHAGQAFANALTNNKDGFTTLLAVVAPNLPAKPDTILFNKVTIKGAKQAVHPLGCHGRQEDLRLQLSGDQGVDRSRPEERAEDRLDHRQGEDDDASVRRRRRQEVTRTARRAPHAYDSCTTRGEDISPLDSFLAH